MITLHPARQRLVEILQQPGDQIDLAAACACIAWEDRGIVDTDSVLGQLQRLSDGLRPRLIGQCSAENRLRTVHSYLFDELRFKGNTWDYSAPENSYIDVVLEQRSGLPILLSIIYLDIGWRLGLPVHGLALPGHFLVCYDDLEQQFFIDPFNRGQLWSQTDCMKQIRQFYGNAAPAMLHNMLKPATRRSILARVLRNLKYTYVKRNNYIQALSAMDRVLLTASSEPGDVRDRGLLRAHMGRSVAALNDLERYARLAPEASDLAAIRAYAHTLVEQIGHQN